MDLGDDIIVMLPHIVKQPHQIFSQFYSAYPVIRIYSTYSPLEENVLGIEPTRKETVDLTAV